MQIDGLIMKTSNKNLDTQNPICNTEKYRETQKNLKKTRKTQENTRHAAQKHKD